MFSFTLQCNLLNEAKYNKKMSVKANNSDNWFEEWFNSEYYHILYKNRDYAEAELFISKLIQYLLPKKNSLLLDVACGKGRHAVYMNSLGFSVDAFDLSKNNIKFAKQYESNSLHFYVNDIRNPLNINTYDFAFNLFTSFGYFTNEQDNYNAIAAIANSVKDNGKIIIDFLNVEFVINNLIKQEVKVIDGITFNIAKKIENGFITKEIKFLDEKEEYSFYEKVKAISYEQFKAYFDYANLNIVDTFGNYNLKPYDKNSSERLIFVLERNK